MKRNSSIELLRIISIFFIILGHFAWHTNWQFSQSEWLLASLVHSFWIGGKLGVDLFVLISGFFLIESKFHKRSIIKTWLTAYFYSTLVYVVALFTGIIRFNLKELVKTVLLAQTGYLNWFVTAYLIMYLVAPFLNILLKNLTKKQFRLLLLLLIMLSFFRTIFHNPSIGTTGNDAVWLIIVYCFGAYIRLFKDDLLAVAPKKYVVGAAVLFLTELLSVFGFGLVQNKFGISNNPKFYGLLIDGFSPFQLLLAVNIFLLFCYIKPFSNYWINKIASTTFAIYLIHANLLIVNWLWNDVVSGYLYQKSYFVLIYGVLVAIIIFVCCSLIDLIRQYIFAKPEKYIIDKLVLLINLFFKTNFLMKHV